MKRFYLFISSLHVGITLLVLLTLTSLVGVIIPQGLDAERYLHRWGTAGGSLLLSIGIDHLFSTIWYNLLIGLCAGNTLLCTINRMKTIGNAIFRPRFLTEEAIISLASHKQFRFSESIDTISEKCTRFFRNHQFLVSTERSQSGISLDIRKGVLKEVGSALLHLSLLPLLFGGFIGKTIGFSYMEMLAPGETVPVRNRPFFLHCDFFKLEQNEQGQVKDYKSGLVLLDSAGNTLTRKVIEVNHPLVYNGIKMYQSSYREDPENIGSIKLHVSGPLIGPDDKDITLSSGKWQQINGTEVSVLADNFLSDFVVDMKTRKPHNRSDHHNNPAIYITMTGGEDTLFSGWVFQKFGAMHQADSTYNVKFDSYERQQITGLLIKENPGSAIVWFGIIFMSVGILMVFWIPRRRYWLSLKEVDSTGTEATVGCGKSRDDPDGENRFDSTVEKLVSFCKEQNKL